MQEHVQPVNYKPLYQKTEQLWCKWGGVRGVRGVIRGVSLYKHVEPNNCEKEGLKNYLFLTYYYNELQRLESTKQSQL